MKAASDADLNFAAPRWRFESLRRVLAAPELHANVLVAAVILLLAIGTIFVFSASFYQKGVGGDAYFFIRRHLMWLPIAVLSGMVAYQFDYRVLARVHGWVILLCLTLLALVLVPGVGLRLNESRRWLPIGPLQFQPSELAKLAMLVFVAGTFSRDPARLRRFWKGFLPVLAVLFAVVVLIFVEPDYGTAMFVLGLTGILLLIAGVRRRYLLITGLVFAPVVAVGAIVRWGLVKTRLLGFLDPEGIHQVKHSLLALGNGGVVGVGLGEGTQKLKFLPEPYTDFIFAIVGEESGFLGCLGVMALFLVVLWAGAGIAQRARDYFGFLLAAGISLALALQAATNIAVVTASAPTKGIPLPLLTFGGSGLCMTLAQIGLLLSIDRVRRQESSLEALAVVADVDPPLVRRRGVAVANVQYKSAR